MSDVAHSVEPWRVEGFDSVRCHRQAVLLNTKGQRVAFINVQFGEGEANAHRIEECVNALAGIEDPAAFVAEARDRMGRVAS